MTFVEWVRTKIDRTKFTDFNFPTISNAVFFEIREESEYYKWNVLFDLTIPTATKSDKLLRNKKSPYIHRLEDQMNDGSYGASEFPLTAHSDLCYIGEPLQST